MQQAIDGYYSGSGRKGKRAMITGCKFSHDQIKKLSKEMVILVDTKEKVNDHITNYFDKKGDVYKRQ